MAARAALAVHRYEASAGHYRALSHFEPDSPRAWYGVARSYEGIAEQAFGELQEQAPDSPLLLLLLADVLVAQQRYADALHVYRQALDSGVDVGGVHQSIADLYERAGKPEWARAELARVESSDQRCKARPVECEYLAGNVEEAFQQARTIPSPPGRYWTIRAANQLATAALARLETLPPSLELHLIRAEVAQTRGRHADAVSELKAAAAMAPNDGVVALALAEALVRARSLDQALPLLDRLTAAQPDSPAVLYLHGEALLQAQRLEQAIPMLERAVKADPANLGARGALGQAYVLAGRFAEAVPHLQAATADDPDGAAYYQLARALQATGDSAEAQQALEEYRKRQPAPPETGDTEPRTLTPPQ
jgi:predicted Zn-dependent protease